MTDRNSEDFHLWRRECGGMQIVQAKRLRDMEKENSRLKKLVAGLSLIAPEVNKTISGRLQAVQYS